MDAFGIRAIHPRPERRGFSRSPVKVLGVRDTEHSRIEGMLVNFDQIAAELQTDHGIVLAHWHDYQPMRELLGMKERHVELAVGNDGGLQIQQSEKERASMPPRTTYQRNDHDRDLGR